MMGSMVKVMDEFAVDLSQTRYPDGKQMFNVTVLTGRTSPKLTKKKN